MDEHGFLANRVFEGHFEVFTIEFHDITHRKRSGRERTVLGPQRTLLCQNRPAWGITERVKVLSEALNERSVEVDGP